jgi:ATP-binding cassette subfamily F protein 3
MIFFNNISLSFAARTIFDNILWTVAEKSRIGLVGDNGTGKTTLLRVIMGQVELDGGSVEIAGRRNRTIGYLPQDLTELEDIPLIDYLKKMSGIAAVEEDIRRYENDISAASSREEADPGLLKAYEGALNELSAKGGYSFEARARQVLNGMGFRPSDAARDCSEFSGGWKMRILLAAILVSNPDIMLLDEPTNHLDTESMEWLESWLKDYQGTIIAVAHDRVFLDKITTQTAELANNGITIYKGNYSFFLKEKQRRLEALRKEAALQRSEIKRTQEFVERFRYKATKARQVQSRLKMLERYEVIQEQDSAKTVKIKFPECPRSGREVASVHNLGMAYGGKAVFRDLNFSIHRGEKIALVGVNGAGKSTLARIMGLVEDPVEGSVKYGLNVRMAYFSQESSQNLDYSKTVWEDVSGGGGNDQERRNLLGTFLFSGDDIHKPVSVLSGGEKSRLALLKILLQDSNFLVLDEPTNHLDLKTKDLFQSALLGYQGTMLIVSHDRYFLDRLIGRVMEIRDGTMFDYPGNYSYFIEKRRQAAMEQTAPPGGAPEADITKKPSGPAGYKTKEEKRSEAQERNRLSRLKKPLIGEMKVVEERISVLEAQKKHNEERICSPDIAADHQRLRALSMELQSADAELERLYTRWAELSEQLEAFTGPEQ